MPGSATIAAEWSILLAACSAQERLEKLSRLRSLLQQSVNWEQLFVLADRHRVQPLLHQALRRIEDAVPASEMLRLKQGTQANIHKALLLSRELIRVLEPLSAAAIEVMPYKGVALAEMLYGDIALRHAGDIDLLIHAKDLGRIRQEVANLGYRSHTPLSEAEELAYLKSGYECAFDGPAGRNLLEVQWAIQPRFYAVDFDMDGLFARGVKICVAGYAVKTPAPADLFVLLSLHAAKHVWGRLAWLCDIARLIQSPYLDWSLAGTQAKQLGIVRILWVTMLAANQLVDVPIPDAARNTLPEDPASANIATEIQALITSDTAYDVESLSYFRLMMGLRERASDRLRFFGRLAFTPGPSEWRALRLPRPLFPLYRLVRISRLAARVVRA